MISECLCRRGVILESTDREDRRRPFEVEADFCGASQSFPKPADGERDVIGRKFVAGVEQDQFLVRAGIDVVNGLRVVDGAELVAAAHDRQKRTISDPRQEIQRRHGGEQRLASLGAQQETTALTRGSTPVSRQAWAPPML